MNPRKQRKPKNTIFNLKNSVPFPLGMCEVGKVTLSDKMIAKPYKQLFKDSTIQNELRLNENGQIIYEKFGRRNKSEKSPNKRDRNGTPQRFKISETFSYKSEPKSLPFRSARSYCSSDVSIENSYKDPKREIFCRYHQTCFQDLNDTAKPSVSGIKLAPLENSSGQKRKRLTKRRKRPRPIVHLMKLNSDSSDEEDNITLLPNQDDGFCSNEGQSSEREIGIKTQTSKPSQTKTYASQSSQTPPITGGLSLEAKTLSMVTIMKALKEMVEEEGSYLVQIKNYRLRNPNF